MAIIRNHFLNAHNAPGNFGWGRKKYIKKMYTKNMFVYAFNFFSNIYTRKCISLSRYDSWATCKPHIKENDYILHYMMYTPQLYPIALPSTSLYYNMCGYGGIPPSISHSTEHIYNSKHILRLMMTIPQKLYSSTRSQCIFRRILFVVKLITYMNEYSYIA